MQSREEFDVVTGSFGYTGKYVTQRLLAAGVMVYAAGKLAGLADALSDKLGLSKGFVGVVLIGWATSLPELVITASSVAVVQEPEMAFGNLFGSNAFNLGILACIDLKEGKRQWKKGRYGHGQMILVDNLLLITTEKGDVVLVEPNPREHKKIAHFSAIKGKTWNNPALAGPYLLVRNSQEAACYELPLLE